MKISILLPYKENFSPNYAGAVSLLIVDGFISLIIVDKSLATPAESKIAGLSLCMSPTLKNFILFWRSQGESNPSFEDENHVS